MLQHIDNFSWAGTTISLVDDGVYAQIGGFGHTALVEDPDPNATGPVLWTEPTTSAEGILRFILSGTRTTVGMACRVWLNMVPPSSEMKPIFHSFRDGANAEFVRVFVNTAGGITCVAGATTDSTTGPVVTANGWYHIETKVVCGASDGTVEVRVEGVAVLTMTGLSIAGPVAQIGHYNFKEGGGGTGVAMYNKDLVYWDGTGAYNNDFVGSAIVHSLVPSSDVALNWQTTGTDGFSILDNSPPNDAAYIYAIDPPPAAYVASLTDLPADVTSVLGVMTIVRARKSDGGDGSLQVGMVSGVDTALGVDRPITTAFTYWRDIFEEDPATTAPWLPGAVNAANLQIDRTL